MHESHTIGVRVKELRSLNTSSLKYVDFHSTRLTCRNALSLAEFTFQMVVEYKLLFTISVVEDHLVFITEIPCTDDFVQKSLCVE